MQRGKQRKPQAQMAAWVNSIKTFKRYNANLTKTFIYKIEEEETLPN